MGAIAVTEGAKRPINFYNDFYGPSLLSLLGLYILSLASRLEGFANDGARVNDEEEGDDPPSSVARNKSAPEQRRVRADVLKVAQVRSQEVHRRSKELKALKDSDKVRKRLFFVRRKRECLLARLYCISTYRYHELEKILHSRTHQDEHQPDDREREVGKHLSKWKYKTGKCETSQAA